MEPGELDVGLGWLVVNRSEKLVLQDLLAGGVPEQDIQYCGDRHKLGYDFEISGDSPRKIEVKTSPKQRSVNFTPYEWKAAWELGEEYWLYVVHYPVKDQPQVLRIQDPFRVLGRTARKYTVTRYNISVSRTSLAGLPVERRVRTPYVTYEEVYELYHGQGLTFHEVGQRLGIRKGAAYKLIKRLGIPFRSKPVKTSVVQVPLLS